MQSKATTPEQYLNELPEDRQEPMRKLRQVITDNLPPDFTEAMSYGMIGYVVPHSVYPPGYHCDTKLPLPFMSIASQKNFVAVYHMGIYAIPELMEWFKQEYGKYVKTKLDMGKSCIRLKKMDQIPYELFGELATKLTAQQWIEVYEKAFKAK
jgi:uncharacterized protein YdhG (YjbR/CyaY superfamily)